MKAIHVFVIGLALVLPATLPAQGINVPQSLSVTDDGSIYILGNTLRPDGASEIYVMSVDRNGELQGTAINRSTHSLASGISVLGNTLAASSTDVRAGEKQEMQILGFDRNRLSSETAAPLPADCSMSAVWPNPVNNRQDASVDIGIGTESRVFIDLYQAKGTVVTRIIDTHLSPGLYTAHFDTRTLPNGTYFCVLNANGVKKIQKVVVQR